MNSKDHTKQHSRTKSLWRACAESEACASIVIEGQLAPFESIICDCYEAGILAPTLSGKRHREPDMLLSAMFLKRALNDLRVTWVLLCYGYTAQAAAVVAALYENALAAASLAGDLERTKQFKSSKSDDIPWSPQQLAKICSDRSKQDAEIAGKQFSGDEYELTWREVYSAYKWLCKMKHPTYRSVFHDIGATAIKKGEYVVMSAPDIRGEDFAVKATILTIAISRTHDAVRRFALALQCDTKSTAYKEFIATLNKVVAETPKALKGAMSHPLPFNIQDSPLARDWSRLKFRTDKK